MLHPTLTLAVATMLTMLAGLAHAQGFKFSQPDESDRQEQQARQNRIAEQLSTPCRAGIKDKKIMVVIGERQSNGYIAAQQQNYGPHFQAINDAPARARPAGPTRPRRSAARSRRPRSTRISGTIRMRR